MKYIYMTTENIDRQPILTSQVTPLLAGLESNGVSTFLVTSGDEEYSDSRRRAVVKTNNLHLLYKFFCFLNLHSNTTSIIHVRSYWAMIPVLLMKVFKRYKIIWDPRGLLPQEYIMRFGKLKGGAAYLFFLIVESCAVKFADAIVVVSNNFKLYIQSKYPKVECDKLHVIRTFSAAPSRLSNNRSSNLSFVYSGSIEAWQCIKQVKDFFHNINHLESCTLTILTKDVEKAICLFNGCSNVTVKSLQPDELTEEIAKYSFAIIFRDDDIINHVAAPIKVADYIKARVPIITNGNVGDYSQALSEFGVGFSWVYQNDISDFLIQLHNYKFDNLNFIRFENEYLSFDHAVKNYCELLALISSEGKSS